MIASEDDQLAMNAINHVASSLLLLFKAELNAPQTARLLKKVSPTDKDGVFRCMLEVSHNGQVKIRDVVVGFCSGDQNRKGYTVTATAENILGIHIPEEPLTNIDKYIDLLSQKKKFAQKISPFFAHTPAEVSVILNKLPQFQNPHDSSSTHSEDDYIHLLKHNTALQSYFKVDDTFAFFTDLSDCDLFKNEVGNLHEIEQSTKREQTQILNALWDQGEIETLYNEKVAASTYRINELFLRLKNDLDRKIRYRKDLAAIPDYTKRNWFAEWLNSARLDSSAEQYPSSFTEEIEQLFAAHFKSGQTAINYFTKTIEAFAAAKYYEQNKRNIEGMINNSLNLISSLYKAQVACRNLKPENLLIKKKVTEARFALAASGTYTIGIIDATACVLLDRLSAEESVRPLQDGFSAYITPSHLLSTRKIKDHINEEKRVLRMQDLYAAIGIIFLTATGSVLFIDTGDYVHQIAGSEKHGGAGDNVKNSRFREINNQFWSTAESELQARLIGDRSRLEQMDVTIPEHFTLELRGYLDKIRGYLEKLLEEKIQKQKIFKHPKLKSALRQASNRQIHQTILKWSDTNYRPETPSTVRTQIVTLLEEIENIKEHQRYHGFYGKKLMDYQPRLSIFLFLILLFHVVSCHMNREFRLKKDLLLSKLVLTKE